MSYLYTHKKYYYYYYYFNTAISLDMAFLAPKEKREVRKKKKNESVWRVCIEWVLLHMHTKRNGNVY